MSSKKILVNYDLLGNEIQNVSLQKLVSDPETPTNGMIWENSTGHFIKYYDVDTIRSLLWASGLGTGQTLYGGNDANGNLTLKTTSNDTIGKYLLPDLTASRVVKIDSSYQLESSYIISTDLDPTNFFSTDATLGGESTSDTKISSQKAVKTYVDNLITGLSWKDAVLVATTEDITLSNTQTIDGVNVTAGDRVLVKDQTDETENGIYIVVSGGAWVRSADANTSDELVTSAIFVEAGTANSNTGWTCTNTSITEWTTEIEFVQFSGAGTYAGGTGIDITGNTIAIDNTVATLTGSQILTNKTLTDNVMLSIYSDSGKTYKLTLPQITDTLVSLAAEQTLTNKTLTSAVLTAPKFVDGGYIADSNGNELLMFGVTENAVNYLKLTNSTAGNDLTLAALGATDTNLNITTTGTGIVKINTDQVATLTAIQTLTNKTLTTPTIASFTNSTHNHTNDAGGGQLTDAALSTAVGPTKGGTGLNSYVLGDILYASATNTLDKLAGNTTTDTKILKQTGNGSVSAAPVWGKYKHTETIGDGEATVYEVTHDLGTKAIFISVHRTASPYDEIDFYVEKTTTSKVTFTFSRALTEDEFTVTIIG